MRLATQLIDQPFSYTGAELRPHYLLERLGIKGSGLVALIGPCEVKTDHLVDWEDRLANDFIRARSMVHFLGEFFGAPLQQGVWMQRLLMSIMGEEVNQSRGALLCRREGDDLFVGDEAQARKLSVSIVTASPVSLLLHSGINIDPAGAPVAAIGLTELKIDAREFASRVLGRFEEECESIDWATAKVRPV